MSGCLTPCAAFAAMITKVFTANRNRGRPVHWVRLFPAAARAASNGRDKGSPMTPRR